MVEAPLALLDEEVEVLLGNAVVAPQMPLRLVPEVLDTVDVVGIFGKEFRVVDPDVMELGNVQHVIGSEAIGIDDGIGPHLVPDDRKKRFGSGIWDDHDMNLAAPFQEPENRNLARSATSPLALPASTEIALVSLNFAAHEAWLRCRQFRENDLPELVEEQDRGVAVHAGQLGCRTGCCARAEILQKLGLNAYRKPAPAPELNHLTKIAFPSYLCQPLSFYHVPKRGPHLHFATRKRLAALRHLNI